MILFNSNKIGLLAMSNKLIGSDVGMAGSLLSFLLARASETVPCC